MAVVVQCFHCNAILELDDGFRGGVCRCSTCGTLLKVPKGDSPPAKTRVARPAGPPAPNTPPKPSEAAPTQDAGPSSGALDPSRSPPDLGGSSSGLGQVHRTRPISHKSKSRKSSPDRGDKLAAALKDASAMESQATPRPKIARSVPAAPANGRTPRWLMALLLLVTACVIAGAIYLYVLHK